MIINGQRYETEPAVEAYVKELEKYVKALEKTADDFREQSEWFRKEFAENCELKEENLKLKAENSQLEEKYQKATGVIATDSLPTRAELYKIKLMCLNHTVCETCEYIGSFGGCGLKGLPEDWSFGGADNE